MRIRDVGRKKPPKEPPLGTRNKTLIKTARLYTDIAQTAPFSRPGSLPLQANTARKSSTAGIALKGLPSQRPIELRPTTNARARETASQTIDFQTIRTSQHLDAALAYYVTHRVGMHQSTRT